MKFARDFPSAFDLDIDAIHYSVRRSGVDWKTNVKI